MVNLKQTVQVTVEIDLFDLRDSYESVGEFIDDLFDVVHDADDFRMDADLLAKMVDWIVMDEDALLLAAMYPGAFDKVVAARDKLDKGVRYVQSAESSE